MSERKILIVEDNHPIRKALEQILLKTGYIVYSASDGEDALKVLETEEPDLIISDIMMPRMNGYDLYKNLRDNPRLNTVPFIFLTALNSDGDVRKGKELGIDDYITKPFKKEDVLSTVRGKLKRRAQLQEVSRGDIETLKKEIIMTLSHEFKTPLTIIQGFTALLLKDDMNIDREQLKSFLKYIKSGGERLDALINDFISMLEIDSDIAKKEVYLLSTFMDLNSILRGILDKYSDIALRKGITLSTDFAEDLPLLVFPLKHITISMEKIIDNAFKFSPKNRGNVKISTSCINESIIVKIEDNGPGIPEKEFSNIFEKFYQIDRKTREQQGAGLGLTIARSYLGANSATIEIKSEINEGTAFIITLPVKEEVRG